MTFHKIIFASSENQYHIPSETVQVVVTSPPYWDLKNYDNNINQIGFNESYELYLERMNKVWAECHRVLKSAGSLFVNINYRRNENQLLRIQDDFIRQLVKLGFIFQHKILWHKPSGIPTAGLRLADRYEYILHFSKNPQFFINPETSFNDYKNKLPLAIYDSWRIVKKAGSIGKQFEHPAMFPDELAQRAIAIASLPNETVLDPFLGSGTSMIAAIKSQRNCYGYELNLGYKPLMVHRLEKEFGMFGNIEFVEK